MIATMDAYKTAAEQYKHQHERWNQWALFFFGAIASGFVIQNNVRDLVPIWPVAVFAAILSAGWVCAALSIRATTFSWLRVLEKLEDSPGSQSEFKLFHEFEAELNQRKRLKDLCQSLKVWTAEPYLRVTRLLTLVGVVMTVLFITLSIVAFFKNR
jgi:hypothetical protein